MSEVPASLAERLVQAVVAEFVPDAAHRTDLAELDGWSGRGLIPDVTAAVVAVLRELTKDWKTRAELNATDLVVAADTLEENR
jgi:hypothetical protein